MSKSTTDLTTIQLAMVVETGRVALYARDVKTHRAHLLAAVGVLRQRLADLVKARGFRDPDPKRFDEDYDDPTDVPTLALDLAYWTGQIAFNDHGSQTLRGFVRTLDELEAQLG